ncbi:EF-hand domain-containing protein [Kiritimatiella glycovorans]|uniref:Calcium-binding EF-hand domain protein n=1 Tax=Kiritimatiella glycovorans TaxID=1307763 RepID=A0A0G3EFY3_9BACT|nr:EF-hand domain-containing protein [Kiritimatiella glycovorans]AKJ65283.1 Calcium-binding EF-hand domain protein [Kiritimatiella glycovorans]
MRTGVKMLTAVCAGLIATAATAQDWDGPPRGGRRGEEGARGDRGKQAMDRFRQVDRNGDGVLSLEEFRAVHNRRRAKIEERLGDRIDPERIAKMPSSTEIFRRIDADESGGLDPREMHGAHRRMREKMQQRRARRGGPDGDRDRGGRRPWAE